MKKYLSILLIIFCCTYNLAAQCTVSVAATSTPAGCYADSGTAEAAGSGGTAPYIYTWNNGAIGTNITNLAAGIYTVTVTDATGCTNAAETTVTSPATFSIAAFASPEICEGGITGAAWVVVSGDTNTVFYAWSDGEGTDTITELPSGNYIITVTDNRGCSKSTEVNVPEPANPLTVGATFTQATCGNGNGTATATASGGNGTISYFWSPTNDTTSNITGLFAGNYTVEVSSGGCTASAIVFVNNSNGPALSMAVTEPTCYNGNNGSITATVSGGATPYTYVWTPGGYTAAALTGLAAGTYSLTVTDHNGCIGTQQVLLGQPEDISVVDYVKSVSCSGGNDGSAVLSVVGGTGPYRYAWSTGDTLLYLSGVSQGSFTVTVSDANGCTAPWQVSILQPLALGLTTTSTNSSGSNGTATAQPTGGSTPYYYHWNNGGNSKSDSLLAAGNYSVTVTDSKGCSASATVTVGVAVGIDPLNAELFSAALFPNPANDVITVKLQTAGSLELAFNLIDISGRLLSTSTTTANGLLTYGINISTLSAGAYVLEIATSGHSLKKRFIIAR